MSAAPANDAPGHRLSFPELEREIWVHEAETVFQSARRHGLRIVGACGGRGSCGTCIVRIAPSPNEPDPGGTKWERACQMQLRCDGVAQLAPRSLAPVERADADLVAVDEALVLDPAVTTCDLQLASATLGDNASDAERVLRALKVPATHIDLLAARALPTLLRQGAWTLRVLQRGAELTGFACPGSRSLGLAVDLGTTNIAAFLIDLETGERVARAGLENPQAAWGADLISRINHAVLSDAAAQALREAVVLGINALAQDLCRAVGAQTQHIVDAVLGGNTAMQHLLAGLPVAQLGRAPFVGALRSAMDLKARDLGLKLGGGAWVHLPGGIGGFVGGDHVSALLATRARWQGCSTSLVMDIGTNTEISLMHQGQIHSASCPSGPALEGGHISCGMRAALGAIENVSLVDGDIVVRTLGGVEAVGLCGSGVLDAVAVLRRAQILNAGGRLVAQHRHVRQLGSVRAAELAPGVFFTQDDVRAVQLAKAAIRTGVELLLREQGLQERDIERFIIAGAFGAYIDVASGVDIGLFPALPMERFEQVGNAAGLGVRQMLCNAPSRLLAAQIADKASYVELSTRREFQKTFLRHIAFPEYPERTPP